MYVTTVLFRPCRLIIPILSTKVVFICFFNNLEFVLFLQLQIIIMTEIERLYLDLLKKSLSDSLRLDKPMFRIKDNVLLNVVNKILMTVNYSVIKVLFPKREDLIEGKMLPPTAESMIGFKRLDNIQYCIEEVVKNKIEGDILETGAWRGGATILMRAVLKVLNVTDKKVWVADSFEGLPKPSFEADMGDKYYLFKGLNVGLEEVKENFERYSMLDDQVVFLKGWFKDTLPVAPIDKLSILRLDGDMYESTMDGLNNMYHKLSIGGYCIVDDYGCVPACKTAIEEFRAKHQITDEIHKVDWTGVYWKKTK